MLSEPHEDSDQRRKIQKAQDEQKEAEIRDQVKEAFEETQKILRGVYQEQEVKPKLAALISLIQDHINKLSDKSDDFLKRFKGFVETQRSGLIELKETLLKFSEIVENSEAIKKVNIQSYKQDHGSLLIEMKLSEKRWHRMRAGVHLRQVMQESLKLKSENDKLSNQPDLSQSDIAFFGELDKDFEKQKLRVENTVKNSYKQNNGNIDFSQKYNKLYFKNYFQERFKLANYFLGDELMKRFLVQNQEYINNKLNRNSNILQQNSNIEKKIYNKEIDPKNFIQQEELESNGRALQKILKINEEIQKELLQDEHQRNLQEMNKIEIQKKQEHWEKVLHQDNNRKSTPNIKRVTTQQQLKKSQTVEKKTIKIKPIISSLKKRTIYYQAHPNFPLISEVYNSHQNVPEERLKKAAISYEIFQQPMRPLQTPSTAQDEKKILQVEDDIYPQQPRLRTPQTTQVNFKGTFFPNSLSKLSRTTQQDFKSLTTLWGDNWNNY